MKRARSPTKHLDYGAHKFEFENERYNFFGLHVCTPRRAVLSRPPGFLEDPSSSDCVGFLYQPGCPGTAGRNTFLQGFLWSAPNRNALARWNVVGKGVLHFAPRPTLTEGRDFLHGMPHSFENTHLAPFRISNSVPARGKFIHFLLFKKEREGKGSQRGRRAERAAKKKYQPRQI